MKIAESILGQMSAPVLVLHEYSHAIFANPAFYEAFNVPLGTLRDKSPQQVLEAEPEDSQLRTILETVIEHEGIVEGFLIESPDNPRTFSMSARRLTFEGRPTDMMLVEMFDITREREREAKIQELNATLLNRKIELERTNEDLESFAHSASHDLRTPLRLIDRVAQTLMERHGPTLPPDALEMIDAISSGTKDVAKLLEKLLDFSRINHVAIRRRKFDMAKLARQAVEELAAQNLLDLSDVTIDDLPFVYADRTLVKQVLVNLLSNAAKFSRPADKSAIHIGCDERDGCPAISVRDNGIGFDMANVDVMFAPFRRLKAAKSYDGTGIGLALVKRIIEHHGGQISAEGHPGDGATFYFTLGDNAIGDCGDPASPHVEKASIPVKRLYHRRRTLYSRDMRGE